MPFSLFGLLLHWKQRIYPHLFLLSCNWSKDCPKQESDQWLQGRHKLRYTQDSLSDYAARSVLKKRAVYDL